MVYALHLEQIDRHVTAERQVAVVLIAAGAKVDLPTHEDAVRLYEDALVAESKPTTPVDHERSELLRALGVAS